MANTNSIPPFTGATLRDTSESLGVTQFPSETSFYQILGGLIIQGGLVTILSGATTTVPLHAPYPTQVLGVFIQVVDAAPNNGYITAVTVDDFDIVNGVGDRDYYWWSIGV